MNVIREAICGICAVMLSLPAGAQSPSGPLIFPQQRGATYAEIVQHQALGRFVIAHDSSFFIYEWSRPYDWAPDTKGLPGEAAARKQTTIFKVQAVGDWNYYQHPKSDYLFYPAAGATYYLGTLSPDSSRVTVYELDRDDNALRVGAIKANDGIAPEIIWFEVPPDVARLDLLPVWTSNEEFVYPVATGPSRLARANVVSRNASPCTDCKAKILRDAAAAARAEAALITRSAPKPFTRRGDSFQLPVGSKLIARSKGGDLEVYSADSADALTLLFRKDDDVFSLLDNRRRMRGPIEKP
jgi:hypothetical protein